MASCRCSSATPPLLKRYRLNSSDGYSSCAIDDTVINDAVHGHIAIPEACRLIVDTLVFQRLRRIKQTGFLSWVYPGAVHTRFEHCLGVCHLAGRLIRHLRERLAGETFVPDSEKPLITDKDILCVQLAGLCHDLGHGPLSHDFDKMFMRRVNPNCGWDHEQGSLLLLKFLLKSHPEVETRLREEYQLDDTDFVFINELIMGQPLDMNEFSWKNVTAWNWPFKGRPAPFAFLFEIIANKSTGIDVDKFDYGKRDAMFAGLTFNFDVNRFIQFSRLLLCPEHKLWHICQPEKEAEQVHYLFQARAMLHRRAYNHRVVRGAAITFCDVMELVRDDLKFAALDGSGLELPLHRAVEQPEVYVQVNDYSLDSKIRALLAKPILEPHLVRARQLMADFDSRRFYTTVGEAIIGGSDTVYAAGYNDTIKKELIAIHASEDASGEVSSRVLEENCIVYVNSIDYGMKGQNPVARVNFYAKNSTDVCRLRKEYLSRMIPMCFMEQYIRVYSRSREPKQLASTLAAFEAWCVRHGHSVSRIIFTPNKRPSSSASATPPPSQ